MNKIDSIIIHCSHVLDWIYVQKILTVCTDKEGSLGSVITL